MNPQQEKKLNEVHDAIVGNKATGHKGIIHRLEELEEHKENDKKFKNKIAGAVMLGTPVLIIIWELIVKLFKL